MEERISQSQVYAEVYAVLSALGGEYIRKIPQNVLNVIADQRDKQLEKKINEEIPLEEQNLSQIGRSTRLNSSHTTVSRMPSSA